MFETFKMLEGFTKPLRDLGTERIRAVKMSVYANKETIRNSQMDCIPVIRSNYLR